MPTITCTTIRKSYPAGFLKRSRKQALDDISFEVGHNEVFGMIGLNGAGKSSILKILLSFIRPDSGTALIAGKPTGDALVRKTIGYLPENPSLYPNLSIREHLLFAGRVGGVSGEREQQRIREVLETVGLPEVANTPIKRFSKGMTQRAALAYAILLEPEILILDEPMSGLDPLGRQMVIDIIRSCKTKGATILFCSHILTDVERICDRIGIMHQGRLTRTLTMPLAPEGAHGTLQVEDGKTPLESLFLQTVRG